MKLTVLICTHNRADLLMCTIASLNKAILPAECTVNILVIANACTDETISELTQYQNQADITQLPLNYSAEPNPGKSNALNHALDLITDGYICFIDDDHRIDNHYFSMVCIAIKQYSKAAILCGQIIPDWTGQEPGWVHDQGKYKIYPLPIPHFELGLKPTQVTTNTRLPGGGNLIVQREVFNKTGGFSVDLGPKGHNLSGSEDSDFILRALDTGIFIQYSPDIIQYHYVDLDRLKLRYLILKSFQRNRSLTLAHNPGRSVIPLYLWRKLLTYMITILGSFNLPKIRFNLMRIAATSGEIIGLIENRTA